MFSCSQVLFTSVPFKSGFLSWKGTSSNKLWLPVTLLVGSPMTAVVSQVANVSS